MLWSAEKMGRRQKAAGVVEILMHIAMYLHIFHKCQVLKAWSKLLTPAPEAVWA